MPPVLPRLLLLATFASALLLPAALALHQNRVVEATVPPYQTARLRSDLDECWLRDGALFVRGWAYVEQETGVRRIDVYAAGPGGTALRIPARVEYRPDVAERARRTNEHDAVHDGFSAASSRVGKLAPAPTIIVVRLGRDGQWHGAAHACS